MAAQLVTALESSVGEDSAATAPLLRDVQLRARDSAERRALGAAGVVAPLASQLQKHCAVLQAVAAAADGADGGHGMSGAVSPAAVGVDTARFVAGGMPRPELELLADTARALRILCAHDAANQSEMGARGVVATLLELLRACVSVGARALACGDGSEAAVGQERPREAAGAAEAADADTARVAHADTVLRVLAQTLCNTIAAHDANQALLWSAGKGFGFEQLLTDAKEPRLLATLLMAINTCCVDHSSGAAAEPRARGGGAASRLAQLAGDKPLLLLMLQRCLPPASTAAAGDETPNAGADGGAEEADNPVLPWVAQLLVRIIAAGHFARTFRALGPMPSLPPLPEEETE